MVALPLGDTVIALAIGVVASVAGGALGGILVGGKALGNELAAMMGSFYGPLAGSGGVAVALLALKFVAS
ncbi:MAG: hypothetical protein FWD12_07370 [Alphaproteobacteria bacterium]|nr:hypothetical protein [Alphaproteobacteria bacterium]